MRLRICPMCVAVGGTWLALSFLVAWETLPLAAWQLPIAMLMGGSVVGIVYQGERVWKWADRHGLKWKFFGLLVGFSFTYLAVSNLSKRVVILELIVMSCIGLLLFRLPPPNPESKQVSELQEKLKKCC